MSSWVEGAAGSAYDVDNLPYGVFSTDDERPRVGVRIGDRVLDVSPVAAGEMLDVHDVFARDSLNPLMAQGPTVWASVRTWLTGLLTDEHERDIVEPHLRPLDEVTMQLPFRVADYVDFYCSLQHASNLGRIFRPDSEPLLPNWRHLPVGYHGRAGTVVVSGTPIRRPSGQRKAVSTGSVSTGSVSTGSVSTGSTTGTGGAAETPAPEFGPSARLDIETELGFVVGAPSAAGEPVATRAFADHVFGVVALNDWSVRAGRTPRPGFRGPTRR
jgi:fumarylacetoacetase